MTYLLHVSNLNKSRNKNILDKINNMSKFQAYKYKKLSDWYLQ